jgi:hypothetical protein
MGEWRYSSMIFDLGTREMSMVSFTTRRKVLGTHWIGGWVGPTAGQDALQKRRILTLLFNFTLEYATRKVRGTR